MTDVDLTKRGVFTHWIDLQVRYNDQDPLGHVNNVIYSAYLEQARCDLIYALASAKRFPRLETVIVRFEIDYRAEITYPGTVEVGTVLTRTGRSSFDLAHGIFAKAGSAKGGDHCHATARTVLAWFDLDARRTAPPPPELAAEIEAFRVRK